MKSRYICAMQVDYLIVGQGLAGSVLAVTLEMQGKSAVIIDEPAMSSSSRIAAGIYNAFNFRKSIPTWRAKETTDAAHAFYPRAEQRTGARFHEQKDIIRLFGSVQEQAEWNAYLQQEQHPFAREFSSENHFGNIKTPHGYGVLEGGGIVYTSVFISAVAAHYNKRGYYLKEQFNHALLHDENERMNYDNRVTCSHVIFCEGHLAVQNPYFSPKSVAPSKGELLHVQIPGLNLKAIINGSVYFAPLGNDTYICGATFDALKSDEQLTEQGKQELISKIRGLTDLPCTVLRHFAGVRPAGRDRKPVLGTSKLNQKIAIFNGMGSKGVLLTPLLAQLLVNHLENGSELPREISISRFRDSK